MAGDLNPPANPTPTMHTLDEIYNQSNSLPNPDEVTIINKYLSPVGVRTWETIHTVYTGKTFYLMGVSFKTEGGNSGRISLSAGSTNFWFPGNTDTIASYPIASVPSDTEIKVFQQ